MHIKTMSKPYPTHGFCNKFLDESIILILHILLMFYQIDILWLQYLFLNNVNAMVRIDNQ